MKTAPWEWQRSRRRPRKPSRGASILLRLENDAGDLAGMLPEEGLRALQIVVAKVDGQVTDALRDARRERRRANEPVVEGKERVVVADRDEVSSRGGSGKLDGRRRDVRTVLRELDHLGARDETLQGLRTLELDRCGPREVGAEPHLSRRGFDDRLEGVPERDGAQAHSVLDVFVPVAVPDVAATPPNQTGGRIGRKLVVTLGVGVRTAGYEIVEALPPALPFIAPSGLRGVGLCSVAHRTAVFGVGVFHTSHGVSPREYMSSRRCFSLKVSMPRKKPSYR